VDAMSRGAKMPRAPMDSVCAMELDVPDVATQAKIVALLDKCAHISSTIDVILEKYDNMVKSRFIEMFGKRTDKKYQVTRISDLVENRITKVSRQSESDDEIDYIDISSVDKFTRTIINSTKFIVSESPSRAQQYVFDGDILMSTVRPNLQNIAILDNNYENAVCSSGFCVLRCIKCSKEFLLHCILDEDFTDELILKATGSNYPAVTSKTILNSTVPHPPFELQNQFADFVKQVDKSKFNLQKMRDVLKIMYKSRMQSYFGNR
jgi:type I restriction enzyme S subunit